MWILLAAWLASLACVPHLLLLNKRPTATLAWLWAILLFPGLGALFYLMVGTERVKRRRRRRQHRFRHKKHLAHARSAAMETTRKAFPALAVDAGAKDLIETLSRITGLPTDTASDVHVLRDADAFYAALRRSFAEAESSIDVESYIWRDDEVGDEFLEILVAAARRGVKVRLLLDEFGCFGLTRRYFRPLTEAGGEFSWCHTLYPSRHRYFFNLRNHRKLQVVDGRTAFVGGMNFGREYLGRDPALGAWSDLQMKLEGPVVTTLEQIFAEDWFFATQKENALPPPEQKRSAPPARCIAQVLRSGPDEDDQPMLRVNLALIAAARKRLWISTGYFIPGETMQAALQVAVARGVDVRLLVSEKSEHKLLVKAGRSYYDALLRQGVRIFEYRRGIEHSKYTVLDESGAVVGSSNFDDRSMRLNFELSVFVHETATNHALARLFTQMSGDGREIRRKPFSRRPWRDQLVESTLRLFSPLL